MERIFREENEETRLKLSDAIPIYGLSDYMSRNRFTTIDDAAGVMTCEIALIGYNAALITGGLGGLIGSAMYLIS